MTLGWRQMRLLENPDGMMPKALTSCYYLLQLHLRDAGFTVRLV